MRAVLHIESEPVFAIFLFYLYIMGQGLSCAASQDHAFFTAVQLGEFDTVNAMLERDPSLLHQTTYDRQYPLHIAAANGQIEVPFLLFFLTIDFGFLILVATLLGFLFCGPNF